MNSLLKAALVLTVILVCGVAVAATGFKSYFFDGQNFREGEGSAAVWVKDGFLPVSGAAATREDALPTGTGSLALFCYLQGSGGKLRPQPRALPIAGVAITVQGKGVTLATRTDAAGYLIVALAPGEYEVKLAGFSRRITIQPGKTALTALRGGKRMVD